MTDQALDKLMRQVLIDSLALEEDSAVPVDFTPSKRHQQQMQLMLKNPLGWYKRKTKPVWKLALQRVAVVFLVASIGFGSIMVVSPTARAAVIRWVVEWYETHIVYRYSGEPLSTQMPQYEILELPVGYVEDKSGAVIEPSYIRKRYQNTEDPNAQNIYLRYIYMQQGSATEFVTEDCDVFDIKVNGYAGQLYLAHNQENRSSVTWILPEENLQFEVAAVGDKEELLRMAESVAIVKEKNQMPQYEIARIPDGFIESDRIENSSSVSLFYEDGNGGVICFDYVYMHQGAATLILVDDNITDITVNGVQGQLFLPTETKNTTTVTWIDANANIQFVIDTSLNQENAITLAESVALVKEKKQIPQYEIAALPEGFTENAEERIQMPEYGRVLYENNDQQWLWLRYVFIQQGAASVINTEGAEVKPVKINGHTGQLILLENFEEQDNTVTWIDEANGIQFTVDGHFNEEEILAIAESVSPMAKERLMPQYEISALPTGYQETDYVVLPSNVSAAYENAAGDMICFDYVYMAQGAAWQFEAEGSELLDVTVNGCKGQLLVPDDPANWTTLTWIDPKQNLQFCIDAVGDKETIICLAESIVLKDTSKGGNK